MKGPENRVVDHYTKGGLFDRIMDGLAASGKDTNALQPEDLKPVDEFHIGGVAATDELLDQLDIDDGTRVLDIGSGIGGPARHIVSRYGAEVTGLDLTAEFVETAKRLTELVDLNATFREGSALDMPFDDDAFDVATLIHVGMNLPDKPKLFSEAARVLRPDGMFAVYDVMQVGEEHPAFPLPWATDPEASFLVSPSAYLDAASGAGFSLVAQRERGEFARAFFEKLAASLAGSSPPPLGLGLVMGSDAQVKVGNMVSSVGAGNIAPVEMFFKTPN